jgi:hypothetical protein
MSETKPIQDFSATIDEAGNIEIVVSAGEYAGRFTLSDELFQEALGKRWILVKERRPENKTFVFAHGDVCQGWVDGPKIAVFYWHDPIWYDANMDAEIAEGAPTHWMPLPLPPSQPSGE